MFEEKFQINDRVRRRGDDQTGTVIGVMIIVNKESIVYLRDVYYKVEYDGNDIRTFSEDALLEAHEPTRFSSKGM